MTKLNERGDVMELTIEQLEDLYFEGTLDHDGKILVVEEEGEWEQDHKFQSLELIFTDGERYYRGYIGRSGSPFTEWTYDSEIYGSSSLADITRVEQVEITTTVWKAV